MRTVCLTAFDLAQRYVGTREVAGVVQHNPAILAMLRLDGGWPQEDEVPWCSAFTNWIAWHLRLPRSKSLMARSWLTIGAGIALSDAEAGNDVVVLSRSDGVLAGHVGFYAGDARTTGEFLLLGGNQDNEVSIAPFPIARVIGVRRLLQ